MKVVRTAVRSVLVLLILSLFAFGQAETGMITGTVTDASGAVVPNATVTATNTQTQQVRNTTSNSAGIYTLTNLQPGIYSVSVQAANFGAFTRQVQVTVGGRSGLDAQLAVQATGTTVEVTAEGGAAVNTESQALSQVVSSQQITQLPTVTRNPYNLVGTAGNVSDTDPSGRGTG
jgi:protocatechuate 3,4-dioxygenase beta subunit